MVVIAAPMRTAAGAGVLSLIVPVMVSGAASPTASTSVAGLSSSLVNVTGVEAAPEFCRRITMASRSRAHAASRAAGSSLLDGIAMA